MFLQHGVDSPATCTIRGMKPSFPLHHYHHEEQAWRGVSRAACMLCQQRCGSDLFPEATLQRQAIQLYELVVTIFPTPSNILRCGLCNTSQASPSSGFVAYYISQAKLKVGITKVSSNLHCIAGSDMCEKAQRLRNACMALLGSGNKLSHPISRALCCVKCTAKVSAGVLTLYNRSLQTNPGHAAALAANTTVCVVQRFTTTWR